jgi:hypothetical protein
MRHYELRESTAGSTAASWRPVFQLSGDHMSCTNYQGLSNNILGFEMKKILNKEGTVLYSILHFVL